MCTVQKTSSFSMSFTYLSFPALIQTEWGPYYQQCCKLICRAANIVDSEDDRRSPEWARVEGGWPGLSGLLVLLGDGDGGQTGGRGVEADLPRPRSQPCAHRGRDWGQEVRGQQRELLLEDRGLRPWRGAGEGEDHDEGRPGVGPQPVHGGRLPVPPVGSLRLHHRAAPTQIPN